MELLLEGGMGEMLPGDPICGILPVFHAREKPPYDPIQRPMYFQILPVHSVESLPRSEHLGRKRILSWSPGRSVGWIREKSLLLL